ncbi:methanogenesis marker protein 6 [Methanomassiliicoccaceae archaeon COG_1]|nr:methanogenesis marker protein 6 [Methanomassiliicoccaceae archaeon COG_1]
MSEERETRLLMISPDSKLTPDQLVRGVNTMAEALNVKETCYGCLIEADRATMASVMAKVRAEYRNEVFSKLRGFPLGDPLRCRAQYGTRPGFSQLEAEWEALPLIQAALDAIDAGDPGYEEPAAREPIPASEMKKIAEEYR